MRAVKPESYSPQPEEQITAPVNTGAVFAAVDTARRMAIMIALLRNARLAPVASREVRGNGRNQKSD